MKKLLLLLSVFVMVSCSKDEDTAGAEETSFFEYNDGKVFIEQDPNETIAFEDGEIVVAFLHTDGEFSGQCERFIEIENKIILSDEPTRVVFSYDRRL